MFILTSYISLFFLLPSAFFIFSLYNDYIVNRDRILLLSNEIKHLQEKQNLLLSEIQKVNVHVGVVENSSSTYLTNTNLFYGLLGLTVLIIIGLVIYNWNSGDTAGLVVDSTKVEANLVADCTKVLSDGIVKLGDQISSVNNLSLAPISQELFAIQLQILNLESRINTIALNTGLLGDIAPDVIKTMHQNSGSLFGFS